MGHYSDGYDAERKRLDELRAKNVSEARFDTESARIKLAHFPGDDARVQLAQHYLDTAFYILQGYK